MRAPSCKFYIFISEIKIRCVYTMGTQTKLNNFPRIIKIKNVYDGYYDCE